MIQQVVVITPDTTQSTAEVLGFVRTTLPDAVLEYLDSCFSAGTRNTSVVVEDNVFTITTQWHDDAVAQYKTLMADVSPVAAQTVADAGWSMAFTPLTADL